MKQLRGHGLKLTLLAGCLSMAGCGGGEGGGPLGGTLQLIDFEFPKNATLGIGPVKLKATTTSGLPVTFKTDTPTVCTVSGDTVTPLEEGECHIIAEQPGGKSADGTTWAAAEPTDQLFTVLKSTQVVTFTPPDYVLSSATKSVQLSAVAASGLPVTFSSDTPAVCTISGTTLTLVGKGSCAVSATQAGNHDFKPQTNQKFIAVDPLLIADGFAPLAPGDSGAGSTSVYSSTITMSTKQGGGVAAIPWSSLLGGWEECGPSGNATTCYRRVSADGSALTSALDVPVSKKGGWYTGFNKIDIFAPGLKSFNGSGDTTSGLRVTTESVLAFNLEVSSGFNRARKPIIVHLDLGKRNGNCTVTLSTQVWAPTLLFAPVTYGIPLGNFAVTQNCGLPGVTAASLDNDVRKLPDPYDSNGAASKQADYNAALDKFAAARTAATTLLKSSDVVRVRFHVPDVNMDMSTSGVYDSDLTISGAITIQ